MELNKKGKVIAGGVGIGVVSALAYERSKEMFEKEKKKDNVAEEILKSAAQVNQGPKKLAPIEKETIGERIQSMSEEEQILVLEKIPMDLIFRHIGNVLEKNRKFIQGINDAMDILK